MSVLVAGALHLDVVVRAPHLPGLDETVTGSSVDYVFGGKGGNQAVAAARMGADVHVVGRAGSDRFGDMIRDALVQSGADLSQLQRDPGASGMSVAVLNAQGEYGAVIVSAANLNIEAEAVAIAPGTSLVLLQNEIPEAVNLAVAQKSKAAGARVWLNAAPVRPVPEALMALVDLLIINRVEAAFYAQAGCRADTLITLGAEGVTFGGVHYPGYAVDVVSTHGAGEMFVGALAAQVDAGVDLARAIGFAQAAAALHVACDHDARAHLTPSRVAAFLAAQLSR
jgi:ribokinase